MALSSLQVEVETPTEALTADVGEHGNQPEAEAEADTEGTIDEVRTLKGSKTLSFISVLSCHLVS